MVVRIIVISKRNSSEATTLAKVIASWAKERKKIVTILEAGDICSSKYNYNFKILRDYQLVVVLGGDGTMLEAVREVVNAGLEHMPILGVKLGGLGFLTALTPENFFTEIEMILAGYFFALPCLMIEAKVERKKKIISRVIALNDIVINKAALARIIELNLLIDNKPLTTLRADGLIIATPTGSTAYNLAAGGPICHPNLKCTLVTPICSFTLNNRPLILNSCMTLTITLGERVQETILTCDGQVGINLMPNDRIIISQSVKSIRLIQSPHKDYFEILRHKLCW